MVKVIQYQFHQCPWAVTAALIVSLTMVGCQKASPSVTASGKVRVGDSVVSGVVITLQPISSTTGPQATVAVFGGDFDIGPEAGLHGGKYRVRFSVMPSEIIALLPPEQKVGLVPVNRYVTREFDIDSQLTWELSSEVDNSKEFEIEFQ